MGHHNYSEHGHSDHRSSSLNEFYGYQGHHEHNKWLTIIERLRENRKLKFLVIAGGTIVLLIVLALILLFLPLIVKLFNYVMQNGVQGILDSITGFVDKLWKGSGS